MDVIIEFLMDCGGGIYYITISVAKCGVWMRDLYVSFWEVR